MNIGRLAWVDFARGVALIGMFVFHLSWDLSYVGYIPYDEPRKLGFIFLARLVASGFLFVSGFCLVLANSDEIQWDKFFKRFSVIVAAAILVSIATYFFMPNDFVYFGILHEIALSSLIGLAFLYTPLIVNILVVIAILVISHYFAFQVLNHPLFWWIGLSTAPRSSFDFVPFIPWFAAPLAGITLARWMRKSNYLALLRGKRLSKLDIIVQKIGRHSLIIYLIHQPIFLAIIFSIALFFPPSGKSAGKDMEHQCVTACSVSSDVQVCRNYCACVVSQMIDQELILPFLRGKVFETDPKIKSLENNCIFDNSNPKH